MSCSKLSKVEKNASFGQVLLRITSTLDKYLQMGRLLGPYSALEKEVADLLWLTVM